MSKVINFYQIPAKNYAILKRFCEKYGNMVFEYKNLNPYGKDAGVKCYRSDASRVSDPTHHKAIRMAELSSKIDIIERSAREASEQYGDYILMFVTEDRSFEYLKYELGMECSRERFFGYKNKFFWCMNRHFFPAGEGQLYKERKLAA